MRYITSVMLFLFITGFYSALNAQTVETDKLDYVPGETVLITGSGWTPGSQVDFFYSNTPFSPVTLMNHLLQ